MIIKWYEWLFYIAGFSYAMIGLFFDKHNFAQTTLLLFIFIQLIVIEKKEK